MQKYTYVLLGEYDDDYYSSEEFLTARAITTWRELISIMDRVDRCKYADSFAEPVTGNLGEIPYSITHIPLLTLN